MIIPELMYFVMLMYSAVNVHVNMGANGCHIKAGREGSILNPSLRKSYKYMSEKECQK